MHRVRGRQTRAHAGAEDRVVGELLKVIGGLAGDGRLRGPQEDLLDVGLPALGQAAVLIAARDHHGRHVHPPCGHQMGGRGLVTGAEADHAVQARAFYDDFDVVDDQVSAGQDVAARAPGTGDEVGRCRRPDLEGEHAECPQLLLQDVHDAIQMRIAGGEIGRRVHDRDLRLVELARGDAERSPLRPAGHSQSGGSREVAAQLAHGVLIVGAVPVYAMRPSSRNA